MEIKEAQDKIDENIKKLGGYWEPLSMLAALVEETGELAKEINLLYGGKKKKSENDGTNLKEELGDLAFTLFALANNLGIDINEILTERMDKKFTRDKEVYK